MLRVAVVTNSLTGGGAERAMNILVNEFHSERMNVVLIPVNSSPQDLISVRCPIFPLNRVWQSGLVSILVATIKFNGLVRKLQPSIVILNTDLPEFLGAFLFQRTKLIVVEHSSNPWSKRKLLGKLVRKALKFKNSEWVSVSSHVKIWPKSQNPKIVIENSLPHPTSIKLNTGKESLLRRLVFIGRLEAQDKRPQDFLEICRQTKLPGVVIGTGLMSKHLENFSNQNELRIDFIGYLHNPWDRYLPGDLLIVPSAREGDGLVILEGISSNVPILVSDITELRRFGFPRENYCNGVAEFVSRISHFSQQLEKLIVPGDIVEQNLVNRNPTIICSKWIEYLKGLEIGSN